jgi:hypothetical protein
MNVVNQWKYFRNKVCDRKYIRMFFYTRKLCYACEIYTDIGTNLPKISDLI